VEQLVAEQPPHDEADADARVVSPPLPLLRNPQADIRRLTFLLLHAGQSGDSEPNTSFSKFSWHSSQQYSYMGIGVSPDTQKERFKF